jgi:hypothetical protein
MADNIVWRWNGPPSADVFSMTLQQPGSEHLAIVRSDQTVVGHAGIYSHNMTHRTAFFEASLVHGPTGNHGRGVGAVALAMWFLLNRHDLRKVYLETTDARATQFRSLVRRGLVQVEGRLTDHVFAAGRYQDALILGITGEKARCYLADRWASRFDAKLADA